MAEQQRKQDETIQNRAAEIAEQVAKDAATAENSTPQQEAQTQQTQGYPPEKPTGRGFVQSDGMTQTERLQSRLDAEVAAMNTATGSMNPRIQGFVSGVAIGILIGGIAVMAMRRSEPTIEDGGK